MLEYVRERGDRRLIGIVRTEPRRKVGLHDDRVHTASKTKNMICQCSDDWLCVYIYLDLNYYCYVSAYVIRAAYTCLHYTGFVVGSGDPGNSWHRQSQNTLWRKKDVFPLNTLFPVNVGTTSYTGWLYTPHKVLSLTPPQPPRPLVKHTKPSRKSTKA